MSLHVLPIFSAVAGPVFADGLQDEEGTVSENQLLKRFCVRIFFIQLRIHSLCDEIQQFVGQIIKTIFTRRKGKYRGMFIILINDQILDVIGELEEGPKPKAEFCLPNLSEYGSEFFRGSQMLGQYFNPDKNQDDSSQKFSLLTHHLAEHRSYFCPKKCHQKSHNAYDY